MRKLRPVLLLALTCLVSSCSALGVGEVPPPPKIPTIDGSMAGSTMHVEEVATGLRHPWDIGFLPDGRILVPQRPGAIALVSGGQPGASVSEVAADLGDVYAKGEGGLMGLVVLPDFERDRKFVTCQTHQENGQPLDVRLVTWTLAEDGRSAARAGELLTGLPINPSGRHSGCRPTLAPDGALIVGTGDTASDPSISQNRKSLGGKVLRIDPRTGEGLPDNPFAGSPDPNERRVLTYGNRNVQGVAVRPKTGQVFTAEHGPTKEDEINLVESGENYGWDPSKGGTEDSYDEDVPMTDLARFPDAVEAKWNSGGITEALSGAAFLTGPRWKDLEGRLAVMALKGEKMLLYSLDDAGEVTKVTLPPEFAKIFGRLRAARTSPDGALYVTTSEGSNDTLLRVTPK